MCAGDEEPGVDDVLVLAQLLALQRLFERRNGVVVALLLVVDAAEVRECVEVVVRALLHVLDDALVELGGARVIAAIEKNRAAEEQCVAEEVRVEERLIEVEEPQRFL